MLYSNFIFVYSNAFISLLWISSFYLTYATFLCFSFNLQISDFILFGYLSSSSLLFRSIIFFIDFMQLRDSRLPTRFNVIRVVFLWRSQMINFQYLSLTQLSVDFTCCSCGIDQQHSNSLRKPLSPTLLEDMSSLFKIAWLSVDYMAFISITKPQSPRRFLPMFNTLSLLLVSILPRCQKPSGVIQLEEMSNYSKHNSYQLPESNNQARQMTPQSRIMLPRMLRLVNLLEYMPRHSNFTPSAVNSFIYRLSFLKFLLASRYVFRNGPIEALMKFLPRSKEQRFSEFFKICQAPCVLIMFSDSLKCFNVLFCFNAIAIIYAPLIPMSLSSNFSVSKALFWMSSAAMHLAPSTPNEFFLMDPSMTPKSSVFKWTFFTKSSKIMDRPTQLIILLDKFRLLILVDTIRFLIACMPYSDMALSARLTTQNSLFLMSDASFIMEFTPNLIEYRFKMFGCFFELIFVSYSLNIFAFSPSNFSPVS